MSGFCASHPKTARECRKLSAATRLPSPDGKRGLPAGDDEVGGFQARVGFARRRGEEKGADTLFRPRATTNKAAARRETDARGREQSNIARATKPEHKSRSKLRASAKACTAVLRRSEQRRSFLCERRRSRRIPCAPARAASPDRNVAKNTSGHSGLTSLFGQQEF
jgi:hypothetical protein